jgi:hypothetical protein
MEESIMAWVTNDGEYSGSSVIVEFEYDDLTSEQWENLENMNDSDRYDYAKAIIDQNDATVRLIEFENFGEEWGL